MLELIEPLLDNNQNFNNEVQNTRNTNSNMTAINSSNNNNICLDNCNNIGINDHFNPSVRLLQIKKTKNDGCCGFHLSRSKWDPYPWVSAVDETTPAEVTGLKVGDCVLEVNGEDILGLRISEIANLVKANPDNVTLLLWSTGNDPSCDPESLCCGPMPLSLERLSASMQTILASLECPVCMEAIPPPVLQCQNGHILCIKCRARSEKCPVCRQRYSIVRSLIAEQIYSSILAAFKLQDDSNNKQQSNQKLREKLFGAKYKKKPLFHTNSSSSSSKFCNIQKPANTFLAKILGKACSLDSLSNDKIKDDTTNLEIVNITKAKHLSLSTNDLSNSVNLVAIPRCPSANRLHGGDIVGSLTLNGLPLPKRPLSLNASVENIGFDDISTLSIPVPKRKIILANLYLCPFGCQEKINAEKSIENHVRKDHNTPIISFGTNSAEISLPLKAPIKNAVFILTLDDKLFWLKLTIDRTDNSIFTMALLQGTSVESSKYMLEARLRNQVENKLLEKELITRSIVYSLMEISWNINKNCSSNCYCSSSSSSSCSNRSNSIHYRDGSNSDDKILGIFYNQNIIKATFNEGNEFLLKIDVKHRNNDEQ